MNAQARTVETSFLGLIIRRRQISFNGSDWRDFQINATVVRRDGKAHRGQWTLVGTLLGNSLPVSEKDPLFADFLNPVRVK